MNAKRLLPAFAAALLLSAVGAAQTTVTASNLRQGGLPISSGLVNLTGVDAKGNAVPFVDAQGNQNGTAPFVCHISAGVIDGAFQSDGSVGGTCQVPDGLTSTPNVSYTATVCDTSVGFASSGKCYDLGKISAITGASFALDHFAQPATFPTVGSFTYTSATVPPTGKCPSASQWFELDTGSTTGTLWNCGPDGNWYSISGGGGGSSTFYVGQVTALTPGSTPTVNNIGTSSSPIFNFGIPSGFNGTNGTNGANGINGVTPAFQIGQVTTLTPGSNATATISGTPSQVILNLGLPAGLSGSGSGNGSGVGITSDITSTTAPLSAAQTASVAAQAAAALTSQTNFWANAQTLKIFENGPTIDVHAISGFPATGDTPGGADAAASIQTYMNSFTSTANGCGSVLYPQTVACGITIKIPSYVNISKLILPSYIRLKGIGKEQSGFVRTANATGPMISLASPLNNVRDVIEDLDINGNAAAQTAAGSGGDCVVFDSTGRVNDTNHEMNNVRIEGCANGWDFENLGPMGEGTYHNLYLYRGALGCINTTTADNKWTDITTGMCGGPGVQNSGANNYFANGKGWYAGQDILNAYTKCITAQYAFISTGPRTQVSNWDAQDSCGNGFYLAGDSNTFNGLLADGNGKLNATSGTTPAYSGVVIGSLYNSHVQAVSMSHNESGATTGINASLQQWGFDLTGNGNSHDNDYDFRASQNIQGNMVGWANSSDHMILNGEQLTKLRLGPTQPATSSGSPRASNPFQLCYGYFNTASAEDCMYFTEVGGTGTTPSQADVQLWPSLLAPFSTFSLEPYGTATATTNYSSMLFELVGSVFGSDNKAHAANQRCENLLGSGTNPTSTLHCYLNGYGIPAFKYDGPINGASVAGLNSLDATLASHSTQIAALQQQVGGGGGSATISLSDDFIGGTLTSGNIGDLNWSYTAIGTGGTPTWGVNMNGTNHPGVIQLGTSATAGSGEVLSLTNSNSAALGMPSIKGWSSEWIAGLTNISSVGWRVGFGSSVPTAAVPTYGAYFRYDTAPPTSSTPNTADTTLMACIAYGGTETCTPLTVAPANSTFLDLYISMPTLGIYQFAAGTNGGTVSSPVTICAAATSTSCTLNTPIGSSTLLPMAWHITNSAAIVYADYDLFTYTGIGLVR